MMQFDSNLGGAPPPGSFKPADAPPPQSISVIPFRRKPVVFSPFVADLIRARLPVRRGIASFRHLSHADFEAILKTG